MTRTTRRISGRELLAALAMLVAAAALLAGCGSDSDSSSTSSKSTSTTSTTPAETTPSTTETTSSDDAATGNVVKVSVVEGKMRFDPDKLTAPAGSVTFEFTNPESIPHDFVIEQDGKKIGGTDLITDDTAKFTVDLTAGKYDFYCTPHRSIGMTGTLTVS